MIGEEQDISYLRGELNALDKRVSDIERIVTKVKHFLYDDFTQAREKEKAFSFHEGADYMFGLVIEELSYVRDGSIDIKTALDHITFYYAKLNGKVER